MGPLSTIMDGLNAMKKVSKTTNTIRQTNIQGKSLIRRANDCTWQLPCLIANTAPLDMASAIARMMDRVYAGYAQIALGNDSTLNLSMDRTPTQFLKRFHQNLRFEQAIADLELPEDEREAFMEHVYDGSYKLYSNPEQTHFVLFNTTNKDVASLLASHREALKPYLEGVNIFLEDDGATTADDLMNAAIAGQIRNTQIAQRANSAKAISGAAPKLTDGDVKRVNDMMPYAVEVRLSVINDKDEFVEYLDCVVGIKTVLHLIDSQDMITNIEHALQNRSGFFRFLRWTTGEISFFKDLVLHADDLKFDALNQSRGKTPFFGNIRRMKRRGIGFSGGAPHGLLPNATMVITSYELEYLREKYGIDLKDATIARKLMETMNMMTFIVCDDSVNTINILYDGDATFQTYTLESIEREISMNSNKLGREIGRMIAH